MIICEACHTEFPKPTTRGRPPKRCEACRAAGNTARKAAKAAVSKNKARNPENYDWDAKSIFKEPGDDPEAAEEAEQIRKRRAKYKTGFCGVTRVQGVGMVTHSEELHNLCPGHLCACTCHKGERPWENNPKPKL